MNAKENISFIKAENKGRGLPFALVEHQELISSNDLFKPTLRDFHVIFWFKKGSGKYFIDFKEYTFKPNTIVLISKDHLQYFETFRKECEVQSIAFNPNFIYRNDTDLKHLFNFNVGCHFEGVQVLNLNETDSDFLAVLSHQMKVISQQWVGKEQGEAFYHFLCLFLIKCEQLQSGDINGNSQMDENTKILFEFSNLLEDNFKIESKVEYYVAQLGLTTKTLSRLIKDKYKLSTKAVIDARRTLEIKRQLKGTTKSVKEVAYNLGFEEPTNMVKYFKKHTGFTPTEFKNN